MAKINLLPWRDERRALRKREFLVMLGVVLGASALVVVGTMQFFDQQIAYQEERNSFLTREIADLDVKIKEIDTLEAQRDKLLQRQKIIEELQSNRSTMVHLFDQLVVTIPDGVYLTGIKQTGNNLDLEGRAQSNARVAQYMRNLEASDWLKGIDLQIVKTNEVAGAKPSGSEAAGLASIKNTFILRVQIENPNAPADADDPNSGMETPPVAQGGK